MKRVAAEIARPFVSRRARSEGGRNDGEGGGVRIVTGTRQRRFMCVGRAHGMLVAAADVGGSRRRGNGAATAIAPRCQTSARYPSDS